MENLEERTLPHKDNDKILTLHSHYFYYSDLMFVNYNKIDRKIKEKRKLSINNEIERSIYFLSWLGFLAVTCEGFKKLKIRLVISKERPESFEEIIETVDFLNKYININYDELRKLRNSVFHLRDSTNDIKKFFSHHDKLYWAISLHQKFKSFFSEYRILCEVEYLTSNRLEESDIRRHNLGKKKK